MPSFVPSCETCLFLRLQDNDLPMTCPHCQRIVYSRQHATCGYCAGALPPEMRLTDAEIAALNAEQTAIAERRALEKEKEEEERQSLAAQEHYQLPPNS